MAHESIETITSLEGFASLADSWSALDTRRWGPLASHDWFDCAARAFCPTTLNVILVRRDGRPVAVAPLCRTQRRGVEWLETIGSSALYEPTQLLASDDQALATLCSVITTQRRPVALHRLDCADDCLAMLSAAARESGTLRTLKESATHFLPAATPWAQVHDAMSAHRRKKLRYARKSIETQGRLTTEIVIPDRAQLASLLDVVVQVESAGWKSRNRSALIQKASLRAFFENIAARLATQQALRICLLRSAEKTLAAQLCVEHSGRFWVLKIGFDEAWSRYSPGLLLTADTIRYALEERGIGFEFLGVAEDWQHPWSPIVRRHFSVAFYPASFAGRTALVIDTLAAKVTPTVRDLKRRIRTTRESVF